MPKSIKGWLFLLVFVLIAWYAFTHFIRPRFGK